MTITFEPTNKIELIAAYEMITTIYNGTFKTELTQEQQLGADHAREMIREMAAEIQLDDLE